MIFEMLNICDPLCENQPYARGCIRLVFPERVTYVFNLPSIGVLKITLLCGVIMVCTRTSKC